MNNLTLLLLYNVHVQLIFYAGTYLNAIYTPLFLQSFAVDGLVNIVGGCCGSTPAHIRFVIHLHMYIYRYITVQNV